MLSFVEDTTKGAHDTLIAACNPRRYEKMGVQGWHASCEENYRKSVAKLSGVEGAPKTAPAPLNLFMNVGVKGDGKIVFEKPSSQQGESVTFKALMGLVIVMSACPMDQKASEDWWPQPREVDWEIVG